MTSKEKLVGHQEHHHQHHHDQRHNKSATATTKQQQELLITNGALANADSTTGALHQQQRVDPVEHPVSTGATGARTFATRSTPDVLPTSTTTFTATTTTTTTTTPAASATKLWTYFERSARSGGDATASKLRCKLCSIELCNYDEALSSSAGSLLWSHLRVKHAILDGCSVGSTNLSGSEQQLRSHLKKSNNNSNSNNNNNNNNNQTESTAPARDTRVRTSSTGSSSSAMTNHKQHHRLTHEQAVVPLRPVGVNGGDTMVAIEKVASLRVASQEGKQRLASTLSPASQASSAATTTTTTTYHHRALPATTLAATKGSKSVGSGSGSIRSGSGNKSTQLEQHLEYMSMLGPTSKASLKPLPSSSLSKNLFARLEQLSEPVTRKLKFWNKKSFQVNQYDPCFKVIYLGNLGIQFFSKDESCLEKPLNTLWNNYLVNMKTEIIMRLTICNSGLKAITRQHGLTQYWSNRLVYCCSHKNYPKIFAWIYRHEGKKMRQELRCHAVFCSSPERASKMVSLLSQRLACALQEFKREKKSRGVSLPPPPPERLSFGATNLNLRRQQQQQQALLSAPSTALAQRSLPRTVPLRRQILAKGSANFRPPLERSKSAPKLTSIREEEGDYEEEEEEDEDECESETYGHQEDLYGEEEQEHQVDDDDDEDDDISRDEFEYEQSFGDRDEEEEEEEDNSDFDGSASAAAAAAVVRHDGRHDKLVEASSLTNTSARTEDTGGAGQEEMSNSSSVYAGLTGDISYDNIVVNKHHLLTTYQERLDNESTQTAPELTITTTATTPSAVGSSSAASSLQRRGSRMSRSRRQHKQPPVASESALDYTADEQQQQQGEQPQSAGSYQHDLDSQIAAERQQVDSSTFTTITASTNATTTNITNSPSHIKGPLEGRDDEAPSPSSSQPQSQQRTPANNESKESSANISKSRPPSSSATKRTTTTTTMLKQTDDETSSLETKLNYTTSTTLCPVVADGTVTGAGDKIIIRHGAAAAAAAAGGTQQSSRAAAAAAADEDSTQDIILSWTDSLLIK